MPSTSNSAMWLGAQSGEPRNFLLTVFVPSQSRDGVPLDHALWRSKTLKEMATLFGGATAVDSNGAWRDDANGGSVMVEANTTVFTLISEDQWHAGTATQLGAFLKRMGRETNQGEVGVIVQGHYFPIREFGK